MTVCIYDFFSRPIHNAVLENDFFAVKRLCLILKHLKNINIQNESYDMVS